MAAHVLDLHLEGLLGPLAGALEGHVLEEMGRAVVGGRLVARSGIDPDSDRGGLGSGDGLGRDAEAGVERRDVGGGGAEDVVGEGRGGGRGRRGGRREGTAGRHPLGLDRDGGRRRK